MSVIRTERLSKAYGSRRGIDDVNLSIREGEIFGFLGPNGAGKSTTIRCLLGFLKASQGRASIFGRDCWAHSAAIKRDVGYVPGDVRHYPWLTADRGFRLVSQIRGAGVEDYGRGLAERFRLETDLPVRKMSRGNRQKLALVLALAHRPKLVVLDEPTSGLDPLMQDTLAACLQEMANAGHTVFFSSHTISEVESLCDRVAIIREGRIVVDESIRDLKDRAPRVVELTFADAEVVGHCVWPEFLKLTDRRRNVCRFEMTGPAVALARWAATEDSLQDINIGKPSLEALFRGFYQDEPAELS